MNSSKIRNATYSLLLTFGVILFVTMKYPSIWILPPYWDSLTGIFREALWLKDNKWNYFDLAFNQSGYSAGGPRTYFYSIYPLAVSLGYFLFENPIHVFISLRLINILALYLILLELANILPLLGIKRDEILLVSVLGITFPVFCSQVFSLNMELLLALSALSAFSAHARGARKQMIFWLLFGVLLKDSGIIPVIAIFVTESVSKKGNAIKIFSKVFKFEFSVPCLIFFIHTFTEKYLFLNGGADGKFLISTSLLGIYQVAQTNLNYFSAACEIPFFLSISAMSAILSQEHKKINQSELNDFITSSIFLLSIWLICILIYSPFLSRYLVCTILPGSFLFFMGTRALIGKKPCMILILSIISFNIVNNCGSIYNTSDFTKAKNDGFLFDVSLAFYHATLRDERTIELVTSDSFIKKDKQIEVGWPLSIALSDSRYGYITKDSIKYIDHSKFLPKFHESDVEYLYLAQNNVWSPVSAGCTAIEDYESNALPPYYLCERPHKTNTENRAK